MLNYFKGFLLFAISIQLAIADTGILKIKVLDSNDRAVSGAIVEASSDASIAVKTAVTDSSGELRLIGLYPSNDYTVVVTHPDYKTLRNNGILVVSGQAFNLTYRLEQLNIGEMEEVVVTGKQLQLVDSTSATVGQDITLDLTESLPTGRSFQAYLQLAPGTKPSIKGNPSSKSGVNYSDAVDADGNTSGSSTDNYYYIDGINITDNNTGGFGANFNSEIIQEQRILTGGIPAEYEGGAGLISKVITKSGSNEWHGSVNYYFQNDDLVADNKNIKGNGFSTFDTAFTLGGPIIQDKLWFFTSYQIKERESELNNVTTDEYLRTVKTDQTLGFAKLTWQPTEDDKLTVSYFNDPLEKNGSTNITVLNNRDQAQIQGGDNYKFEYTHNWENVILTLEAASHEGEFSIESADKSARNDVAFFGGNPSNEQLNLGGRGRDIEEFRNKDEWKITLQYFLDTKWGNHDIKLGYAEITNERLFDLNYTGNGAQYTSIGSGATTLGQYVGDGWTGTKDIVRGDYDRIIDALSTAQKNKIDTNGDSVVSPEELDAITFNSTTGNPDGLINAYRILQVQSGAVTSKSKGTAFYVQDAWSYDQWTVSAGVRAEEWVHYATDGSEIYTFDTKFAPRFSVVYDLFGDGESKVWGFYGRYYDPVRTDMTSFAGTLTGPVRDEAIYIDEEWVTFRTRGGAKTQDALFSPNTKTPYTDEYMIGYSKSFTEDISVEVTYTNRKTKDILEDYDLDLYTNRDIAGGYTLPLSYFGYKTKPVSNYVIGTLKGAKREYQGIELVARKRRIENWQLLTSYTYNWAKGNSNSDGNADYQGDVLYLDPRAPNVWGDQPGNIEHIFKIAGSYFWDNGLEAGLVYSWNSGIVYNTTEQAGSRHLPIQGEAYDSRGANEHWVQAGAVGSNTSDSFGTLDLRIKYTFELAGYTGEFFFDIFNALDDQAGLRQQDLKAGDGSYQFGKNNAWVEPRRLYLGARFSF